MKPSARNASKIAFVTSARGSAVNGVGGERDAVVGVPRVEHAEAVVVLRGEHDVRMPASRAAFAQRSGSNSVGLNVVCSALVRRLVLVVVVHRAPAPVLVLGAERPGLDDAPLGVGAPVHEQAELQVLPLLELLADQRIRLLDVGQLAIGHYRWRRSQRGHEHAESQENAASRATRVSRGAPHTTPPWFSYGTHLWSLTAGAVKHRAACSLAPQCGVPAIGESGDSSESEAIVRQRRETPATVPSSHGPSASLANHLCL